MDDKRYIQVILPLRLEWEPCYLLPEGVQVAVGDRVRVRFAQKEYVGAVSALDVTPQTDENRILPILAVEASLPKVLPEEIRFWRAVSDYYLCSVGEVYKAAYPSLKIDQEEVEARVKERLEARLERLKDKEEKARRDDTRQRYRAEIEAVEALLRGEKPAAAPASVTLSSVYSVSGSRSNSEATERYSSPYSSPFRVSTRFSRASYRPSGSSSTLALREVTHNSFMACSPGGQIFFSSKPKYRLALK